MAIAASAPVLLNQKKQCRKIARFTDAPCINEDKIDPNTDNFMIFAILYFYNLILVQNNDEILLHFKPVKLIFMNYSVWFPQNLLFTCDLMMAW